MYKHIRLETEVKYLTNLSSAKFQIRGKEIFIKPLSQENLQTAQPCHTKCPQLIMQITEEEFEI